MEPWRISQMDQGSHDWYRYVFIWRGIITLSIQIGASSFSPVLHLLTPVLLVNREPNSRLAYLDFQWVLHRQIDLLGCFFPHNFFLLDPTEEEAMVFHFTLGNPKENWTFKKVGSCGRASVQLFISTYWAVSANRICYFLCRNVTLWLEAGPPVPSICST